MIAFIVFYNLIDREIKIVIYNEFYLKSIIFIISLLSPGLLILSSFVRSTFKEVVFPDLSFDQNALKAW